MDAMIGVNKDLAHTSHRNVAKKLILLDDLRNFKFNVTSASTRKRRCKDFLYNQCNYF